MRELLVRGPLNLHDLVKDEVGRLFGDGPELLDEGPQAPIVPDPLLIELGFSGAQAPVHRFPPDLRSPLEIGPVRLWRVGVAAAVRLAAVVVARGDAARADEAELGELREQLAIAPLLVREADRLCSCHRPHSRLAEYPPLVIR